MAQKISKALSMQSSDMEDSSDTLSVHSSDSEVKSIGEGDIDENGVEEEDIEEEDIVEVDIEEDDSDSEDDDSDSSDEDSSDDDDDRSQTSSQAYFHADDHDGQVDYIDYKYVRRPHWLAVIAYDQIEKAEESKKAHTFSTEELADGVQSLPSELYLKILELTFSTAPGEIFIECENEENKYVPPAILQVSHATRAFAAQSYYNNTSFIVAVRIWRHWAYGDEDSEVLENAGYHWLDSLSMQHREELREVRVVSCNTHYGENDVFHVFGEEDFGLHIDWMKDIEDENDSTGRCVITVGLNGHVSWYFAGILRSFG